jgi:hypothetical protein
MFFHMGRERSTQEVIDTELSPHVNLSGSSIRSGKKEGLWS